MLDFFSIFFKNIDDSDLYDLYICLHRYINMEQFENIKLFISEEQFDSIVEAYHHILFKRSNKVRSIKVVFEKCYYDGVTKNASQILHHFYKNNETEPFLTYHGSYVMNKDDVVKYVSTINWIVLDNNCEIIIEEKKTLIKFIRIVISNDKCYIFDDIYDQLLYESDTSKDSFTADLTMKNIYCDAIKQLVKNHIVDKKYQLVLMNKT